MAMLITDNISVSSAEMTNASFESNISQPLSTALTPHGRPALPEYLTQTMFICDHVLMPLICSLGIIGNGLSLCVLTRREMVAATTCFFTALAVSDLLLLLFQIPAFFELNSDLAASFSFKQFIRVYSIIR
jgi:hypothetical protein